MCPILTIKHTLRNKWSILICFVVLLVFSTYGNAQPRTDSLTIDKIPEPILKKGEELSNNGKFKDAAAHFKAIIHEAKKEGSAERLLKINFLIVSNHHMAREYDSAYKYLDIAKKLIDGQRLGHYDHIWSNAMGTTLVASGREVEGMQYLFRALLASRQVKDHTTSTKSALILSQAYLMNEDLINAKKYLDEAGKFSEGAKEGNLYFKVKCLEAQLELESGNISSAQHMLEKLESETHPTNNILNRLLLHGLLAKVYLKNGDQNKAFSNGLKGLDLTKQIQWEGKHVRMLNNVAKLVEEKDSLPASVDSIFDLKRVHRYEKEEVAKSVAIGAYQDKKLILENQQLKKLLREKDSLGNSQLKGQITELSAKYEHARQKAAIDQLTIQNQEAQISDQKRKRRLLTSYILIGLLLMLLAASYIYFRYRREKLKRLERKKERSRIARKLHNIIANDLLASIYGIGSSLRTKDIGSLEKEHQRLVKQHAVIRDLSHSLENESPQSLHAECIQVIERYLSSSFHLNADISILHKLEGRLDNEKCSLLLESLHELLANVAKHAQARNCTVKCIQHYDTLTLEVADDGVGIAQANNFGFGLQRLSDLAESIDCRFTYERRERGLLTRLSIPLQ